MTRLLESSLKENVWVHSVNKAVEARDQSMENKATRITVDLIMEYKSWKCFKRGLGGEREGFSDIYRRSLTSGETLAAKIVR